MCGCADERMCGSVNEGVEWLGAGNRRHERLRWGLVHKITLLMFSHMADACFKTIALQISLCARKDRQGWFGLEGKSRKSKPKSG